MLLFYILQERAVVMFLLLQKFVLLPCRCYWWKLKSAKVMYRGVSKRFCTSATRCSCIAILWVSLVSFSTIILCVASQQVFVVVISLWLSPETFGYTLIHNKMTIHLLVQKSSGEWHTHGHNDTVSLLFP
jgi:hypothetical protein